MHWYHEQLFNLLCSVAFQITTWHLALNSRVHSVWRYVTLAICFRPHIVKRVVKQHFTVAWNFLVWRICGLTSSIAFVSRVVLQQYKRSLEIALYNWKKADLVLQPGEPCIPYFYMTFGRWFPILHISFLVSRILENPSALWEYEAKLIWTCKVLI